MLFSSNPRGADEEGWNRGRYGAYWNYETWQRYLVDAGFTEFEHYYRPPGCRASSSRGSPADQDVPVLP